MKGLIIVHYFLPHVGGMEAVVEKQAKSLVELGNQVTVLTCRPGSNVPLVEQHEGYTIKRLPALNIFEKRFGIPFPIISPAAFLAIARETNDHDIIHIHDVFYMSSHFSAIACLMQRRPFFLTQHVAMVDHPNKLVMAAQKAVYKTMGKLLFTRAEKIVCYNRTVENFLKKYGAHDNKILSQHNGIDTQYFSPVPSDERQALRSAYNLPKDRPIILFVGRFVPKKGFNIVYNAQSSDYLIVMAGSGTLSSSMQQNENVRLFGQASPQQLRDLYRLSDVFVFPAVGEIFTLVMQEAMACGLPVITTDDPGYRTYDFSRKHILLIQRNSNELRRKIKLTLENSDERVAMSVYVRDFALKHFNWQYNYPREYAIYTKPQTNYE